MSRTDLVGTWRRAQLAEVLWRTPDGAVDAAVVVPLLDEHRHPVLALTYDRRDLAHAIATAVEVHLAVTSPAVAADLPPVSAPARCRLQEDPTGDRFVRELLPQELAKHPPSRRRADSPLLRREHWWYLPRLLLTAVTVGLTADHPTRDGVAGVATAGGLHLDTVTVADDGEVRSGLPDGPAVVLQHGGRVPDLEHRWTVRRRGHVRAGRFTTSDVARTGDPHRPPGQLRRWAEERALERGCRAGLRHLGA